MSHAAVKSFDRRGVSCKNARTVQFSGGGDGVSEKLRQLLLPINYIIIIIIIIITDLYSALLLYAITLVNLYAKGPMPAVCIMGGLQMFRGWKIPG